MISWIKFDISKFYYGLSVLWVMGWVHVENYDTLLIGWKYARIGEFQCYDKYLFKSLQKAAETWGNSSCRKGPENPGSELRTLNEEKEFPEALADPEGLAWQVLNVAWEANVPAAGQVRVHVHVTIEKATQSHEI
ncbi:hypothetical protein RND71_042580 [Anisodus tanguticus]|uniref:Uncharacterized protein n=1 Tax=Anisodus tanguticus TaxID=243964 RepID=A0AAE1UN43_9SOLA|nr:hypothetical protein RND71_042580 [Anisodus tanguticus]